ncbi:MAG: radical SAM protein [Pseudobdellovibrio sp.]
MDLFIATLPPVGTIGPLLGPALVFSAAKKAGYSAKQVDFSLDFFLQHKNIPEVLEWLNFDSYSANESGFIVSYLDSAIEIWIQEIIIEKPRWVGFSAFSVRCIFVLNMLLPRLKKAYPAGKIVVGGSGIIDTSFYKQQLELGLIDAFVQGEGEVAIVDILAGRINSPGINGKMAQEIENLNELSNADYSGLKLSEYGQIRLRDTYVANYQVLTFYVEGSRGCVRKCSFCDVPFIKPGYRYRTTNSIGLEIRKLLKENSTAHFIYFVDSLVNGSLKHLKELCYELEDIKTNVNTNFFWSGYFIVRSKESFSRANYELLARSGARQLKFGVESGSAKVRKEMNKNNSDEDIDYNLSECARVSIGPIALLMIGFPTETEEDFYLTIQFLRRNKNFLKIGYAGISVSWKVGIAQHKSALAFNPEKYGVKYDLNGEWYSEHVNILISSKRYFLLCDEAENLGIINKNKCSKKSVLDLVKAYNVSEKDLDLSEKELHEIYKNYLKK